MTLEQKGERPSQPGAILDYLAGELRRLDADLPMLWWSSGTISARAQARFVAATALEDMS